MTLTSIVGDKKEYAITTPISNVYNGGGSGRGNANHKLIAIDTPQYEQWHMLTFLPIQGCIIQVTCPLMFICASNCMYTLLIPW